MATISHALVLPDADFRNWYNAAAPYTRQFERVNVVRSPRGNDLNRFRDVTAVAAPGVWVGGDPLSHIRRAYPSVIRIDVIRANTPAELAAALTERISRNDRYGEQRADGHISDRFAITWMSDARPAAIINRFNFEVGGRRNEGIDITAPAGSKILAAVAGTVARVSTDNLNGYGTYLQVNTPFNPTPGVGAMQTYTVTYANLATLAVGAGQAVKVGDTLGTAAGAVARIIVQGPNGATTLIMPNVHDPAVLLYWDALRVRPTVDGLRIREKPGTAFKGLQQVYLGDILETLEGHGRTLEKLGRDDAWLKVRTPIQIEGYTAGWLLEATTREASAAFNLTGMNLDFLHPLGKPSPERLAGLGWIRLPYKSTPSQGFASMEAAHQYYAPLLTSYAQRGYRILVILTHQTFGEGGGFRWEDLYNDSNRWNNYIAGFVEACRSVARRYVGKNIVAAYQIWNEQDTPPGNAVAAVPIKPGDYARMLSEATKAIHAIDPLAKVITGGHIGGPSKGADYARQTFAALPPDGKPDGIACHSYGRGAPTSNPRYTSFGNIAEDINTYEAIMPGAPVWITEWGVLDMPDDAPEALSRYAVEFLRYVKTGFRRKVAAAMWYAWADGMHNGYGLVDRSDRPKYPLYDDYLGN